jgi:hypothetical protein
MEAENGIFRILTKEKNNRSLTIQEMILVKDAHMYTN